MKNKADELLVFINNINNKTKSLQEKVHILLELLRCKDRVTLEHSRNTAEYAGMLGNWLDLVPSKLDALVQSTLLHDIGKLSIAGNLLQLPRKLTAEEFGILQKHTTKGADILKMLQMPLYIINAAEYHHERIDGRGYPHRIYGENIPEFSRIIAIVDAFDALTSDRPYRKGIPSQQALRVMKESAGQFDQEYLNVFIRGISD